MLNKRFMNVVNIFFFVSNQIKSNFIFNVCAVHELETFKILRYFAQETINPNRFQNVEKTKGENFRKCIWNSFRISQFVNHSGIGVCGL